MKEYTCQLCNKTVKSARLLTLHIYKYHKNISVKQYYDLYLKDKDEGICKQCGNETKFLSISKGYTTFCSRSCANNNKEKQQRAEQTTLKHFGVNHPAQSDVVLNKMAITTYDRYGVYNISQLSSVSQNKSDIMMDNWNKYHDEYINKTISTSLSIYGCESPNQSPLVKKKQQDTCFKHYGVKNCQQSKEIQEKTKKDMH